MVNNKNTVELNHTDLSKTAKQNLRLLHVVRRYGPVGGMERYAWELTLHLQRLGYQVTVICERCHVEKPAGIDVHELGEVMPRPRWIAALRFSRRVARWLAANPQSNTIIHSHERIRSHDITTFHGTSFLTVFEKPWWQWISLRVAVQLFLEWREMNKAAYIAPNSHLIKQQLEHYYPKFAHKLTSPILPGVTPGKLRAARTVPHKGGVVGFVGTEWKRKGLPTAVAAIKQLRSSRPDLQFVVIGPCAADIQHLFADWQGGYTLKGWSEVEFAEFDVLIHPAKFEPYGMVISEAMAAKVPVVFSDTCGAEMNITPASGKVLPLTSPIKAWADALEQQLSRTEPVPQYQRSWDVVAREYEGSYHRCWQQEASNEAPPDFELSHSLKWMRALLAPNEHGTNYYR